MPAPGAEPFQRLGERLRARWQRLNFREEAFPLLAFEALVEEPLHLQLDPLDPIRWAMSQTVPLPPQRDLGFEFGQPPLVVFSTDRFYIQVLHWLEGTTSIHQHGFTGAFQVLGGSSLHSEYTFDVHERVNNLFLLGQLNHQRSELLTLGATRQILPDHQFIHALFHLDQPSVTVVVRTFEHAGAEPQYLYLKPGIGRDPFVRDANTVRKVQGMRLLSRLRQPELPKRVGEMLEGADLTSSFSILQELLSELKNPDLLGPYLERVQRQHGASASMFEPALQAIARDSNLVSIRSEVTDPELRFFLALLLNFDRRDLLFAQIQNRFPGQNSVDLVVSWIGRLSEDPDPERNPLRITLDETSRLLLRCALEGLEGAALLRRFEEDYETEAVAEQAPQLIELSKQFRTSPLLAPLFRG